jgi:hypothetical protein
MKRLAVVAAVACLCGCALAGTGYADSLVYSTFGEPGDTFSSLGAFGINGSGNPGSGLLYSAQAMAFQPSASVTLDTIRFAASSGDGCVVDLVLAAADSSGAPGTALETFSSITPPNSPTILTESSVSHPSLVAGTTYWLELQPHDPTTAATAGWAFSSPAVSGTFAFRSDPAGAWSTVADQPLAAFDVSGAATTNVIPEPPSFTLLSVGAVGLAGYGWRKRRRAAA